MENCEFKGEIYANSGQLKHADWRRHASHKAAIKAREIGASHLVVERLESVGVFHGKVKALAFVCDGGLRHIKLETFFTPYPFNACRYCVDEEIEQDGYG